MQKMVEIFNVIGDYGLLLQMIIIIYYINNNNENNIIYQITKFLILVCIVIIINIIIKIIVKEERPIKYNKTNVLEYLNYYGMPSGHTQLSIVLLLYYILQLYKRENTNYNWLLIVMIIVSVIINTQRYYSRKHSKEQIIIGNIVGIIIYTMIIGI